ncbi:MAG: polyketide cyclase [Sneathiella sp.]
MKEDKTCKEKTGLVFECELEAQPEKVWRAISIAEFRDRWLPSKEMVALEVVSAIPGRKISYRMKEIDPPFLESVVTFQVTPGAEETCILRIVHELSDDRELAQSFEAANNNGQILMCAA